MIVDKKLKFVFLLCLTNVYPPFQKTEPQKKHQWKNCIVLLWFSPALYHPTFFNFRKNLSKNKLEEMKLLLLNVLLCVTMNGLFEYKHHHITKYQLDNPDPDSSILSFIPERIISTLYLNGKFLVKTSNSREILILKNSVVPYVTGRSNAMIRLQFSLTEELNKCL